VKFDRISLAAAAAGMSTFLNLYTPQAVLPSLAASFHVPIARTGLTVTTPLLAVAMVAPFAGAISDAYGRKKLIVGAALAVTVPTVLVALSATLDQMLLWRFIQGLLLPFIFAVMVAYIGEECEGAAAIRAAGVYASGAILGGFSGRFVAGIAAEFGGWRLGFLAAAVLTGCAAVAVFLLLPTERKFRRVTGGVGAMLRGWRLHARNALLWGTCAVGAAMLFTIVATFTYVNFRLAAAPFGLSPGELGSVFTVYLVGVVTTPLATRLAVSIGRQATTVLGATVAVVGELLTLLPTLPFVVIGLVLASAGLFVAQALALGFIGVAAPQARSSAVGMYVTIYYTGGALGGIVPGWLWLRYGWPGCVALSCVVLALMAAAASATFRRRPAAASLSTRP
jgi:predicted MFS family arabinose efflux permease